MRALPFIACILLSMPARADDAADTATARALGIEGVTLADAGRCPEAIEKLERAEKLHHAPTTATRLGECEIAVGRLVRGTERLQRVVREPLSPNAHPAFAAAVTRAGKALEAAAGRIPTLTVSVKAPPRTPFAVTVNGEPLNEAALDVPRRVDPGSHKVHVSAPGFVPQTTTVSLDEGQTRSTVLELVLDPYAAPPAEPTQALQKPEPRSKVPAILAFSVGAIGLGAGIYSGVVVGQKSSELANRCDANKVCPESMDADIAVTKRWATVSTIGFATAGAGIFTGVLLLAWPESAPTRKTGFAVRPSVGAGSMSLEGRF